jgi:hypothetical protein
VLLLRRWTELYLADKANQVRIRGLFDLAVFVLKVSFFQNLTSNPV